MYTSAVATLLGLLLATCTGCTSAGGRMSADDQEGRAARAADLAKSSTSWIVREPENGNPLRVASLYGPAWFDGRDALATIEVGCHADDDGSTLTIGFRIPKTMAFDFDAFEGPEGIGQTHPLLRFGNADGSTSRHLVGGWWADADTYMFSANLPISETLIADLSQWPTQYGRSLEFAVLTMTRNSDPDRTLSMRFSLPPDGSALAWAIAPCFPAVDPAR